MESVLTRLSSSTPSPTLTQELQTALAARDAHAARADALQEENLSLKTQLASAKTTIASLRASLRSSGKSANLNTLPEVSSGGSMSSLSASSAIGIDESTVHHLRTQLAKAWSALEVAQREGGEAKAEAELFRHEAEEAEKEARRAEEEGRRLRSEAGRMREEGEALAEEGRRLRDEARRERDDGIVENEFYVRQLQDQLEALEIVVQQQVDVIQELEVKLEHASSASAPPPPEKSESEEADAVTRMLAEELAETSSSLAALSGAHAQLSAEHEGLAQEHEALKEEMGNVVAIAKQYAASKKSLKSALAKARSSQEELAREVAELTTKNAGLARDAALVEDASEMQRMYVPLSTALDEKSSALAAALSRIQGLEDDAAQRGLAMLELEKGNHSLELLYSSIRTELAETQARLEEATELNAAREKSLRDKHAQMMEQAASLESDVRDHLEASVSKLSAASASASAVSRAAEREAATARECVADLDNQLEVSNAQLQEALDALLGLESRVTLLGGPLDDAVHTLRTQLADALAASARDSALREEARAERDGLLDQLNEALETAASFEVIATQAAASTAESERDVRDAQEKISQLTASLAAERNALESAQSALQGARNEISVLKGEAISASASLGALTLAKESAEAKVVSLARNLDELQNAHTQAAATIASLEAQLDAAHSEVDAVRLHLDGSRADDSALIAASKKNTLLKSKLRAADDEIAALQADIRQLTVTASASAPAPAPAPEPAPTPALPRVGVPRVVVGEGLEETETERRARAAEAALAEVSLFMDACATTLPRLTKMVNPDAVLLPIPPASQAGPRARTLAQVLSSLALAVEANKHRLDTLASEYAAATSQLSDSKAIIADLSLAAASSYTSISQTEAANDSILAELRSARKAAEHASLNTSRLRAEREALAAEKSFVLDELNSQSTQLDHLDSQRKSVFFELDRLLHTCNELSAV